MEIGVLIFAQLTAELDIQTYDYCIALHLVTVQSAYGSPLGDLCLSYVTGVIFVRESQGSRDEHCGLWHMHTIGDFWS